MIFGGVVLMAVIFVILGNFMLPMIIVLIGMFVLIYLFCQPGAPGPNRFGRDPPAGIGQISPHPTA